MKIKTLLPTLALFTALNSNNLFTQSKAEQKKPIPTPELNFGWRGNIDVQIPYHKNKFLLVKVNGPFSLKDNVKAEVNYVPLEKIADELKINLDYLKKSYVEMSEPNPFIKLFNDGNITLNEYNTLKKKLNSRDSYMLPIKIDLHQGLCNDSYDVVFLIDKSSKEKKKTTAKSYQTQKKQTTLEPALPIVIKKGEIERPFARPETTIVKNPEIDNDYLKRRIARVDSLSKIREEQLKSRAKLSEEEDITDYEVGFGYDSDDFYNLEVRFGDKVRIGPSFGLGPNKSRYLVTPVINNFYGDGSDVIENRYAFGLNIGLDVNEYIAINYGLGFQHENRKVNEKIIRSNGEKVAENTDSYSDTKIRTFIGIDYLINQKFNLGPRVGYNGKDSYAGLMARLRF